LEEFPKGIHEVGGDGAGGVIEGLLEFEVREGGVEAAWVDADGEAADVVEAEALEDVLEVEGFVAVAGAREEWHEARGDLFRGG